MDARPVVLLPLSVGAFAVGPVEPHLHQGTVAGQELLELPTVEIVVPRRVAITGLVAVPGREVQADPARGQASCWGVGPGRSTGGCGRRRATAPRPNAAVPLRRSSRRRIGPPPPPGRESTRYTPLARL